MKVRRIFLMLLVLLFMPVGFEPVVAMLGKMWG